MTTTRALILTFVVTAVLGACAEASTSPDLTKAQGSGLGTDSTSHTSTTPFRVSGRVLAMSATTAAQGSDTLHYTPIANIPLRVMRNVLVNGSSSQVLAANTTSDANGAWHVDNLAGGYYVVYAEPTAASPYAGSYSYIAGTSANVTVDLYVWRKP